MKFIKVLLASLAISFTAQANDEPLTFAQIKEIFPSAQDTGYGNVGQHAKINLKDGLILLNGSDGNKLLESWGNLPSQLEGLILDSTGTWCITFEFDNIGYVKDDEKEDLNADEILKAKKEAQEESNKMRQQQGLGNLFIQGWSTEPNYNPDTNNLEWGMMLRDDSGVMNINHEVRILGRHGVMNATLICSPEEQTRLLPTLRKALASFEYNSGNKYSEFKEGDKIAEYGLTGLIVGGGAFVIWKFWKFIVAGVVALGAGIKKIFGKAKATTEG